MQIWKDPFAAKKCLSNGHIKALRLLTEIQFLLPKLLLYLFWKFGWTRLRLTAVFTTYLYREFPAKQ